MIWLLFCVTNVLAAFIGKRESNTVTTIFWEWESTFVSFASWAICVPIGCRHPFIRYWQPLLAKTKAASSLLHPDVERQQSVNSFGSWVFGNQGIVRIFTPITEPLTDSIGQCTIYERFQHGFQINRHCTLQSMQKCITGCWKHDFDKILLTNCKNKSRIWIYGWTRWATHWQPTQFRSARSIPSNRTQVDISGSVTTWTASLATDRFRPGPGPEVTVRNRC